MEEKNRPSGWTVFEVPGDSGLYVGTDDVTVCRVNSGSDDDEPDGICRVTAEAIAEIPGMIAELESWRDMCLHKTGKCPEYPNCRTCEIIDKLTMFRKAVLHVH